jgi:hypothetical protein
MEYITIEEWYLRYGNNGCHPDFIKQSFNRKRGSETFPILPFIKGMLEVDSSNGSFLQPYKTSDGKTWALVYAFDHSYDLDLKSREEIKQSLLTYATYSIYNWPTDYLTETLEKHFPDIIIENRNIIVLTSDGERCGRQRLTHQEFLALKFKGKDWIDHINSVKQNIKETCKRLTKECLGESVHIEKPVRLWIGGWDDSSYARCFESQEEANKVFDEMKTGTTPKLLAKHKFIFTN